MGLAERWMARAQQRSDLRAERFLRHEEGVRAGTERPSFLESLSAIGSAVSDNRPARRASRASYAPPRAMGPDGSLKLAHAWLTWVKNGPVSGPDGVAVSIWIRFAGQDLPYHHAPDAQRRREIESGCSDYTVCLRRDPGGPVQHVRTFGDETTARWYAVALAQQIRQSGFSAVRPGSFMAGPPTASGMEDAVAEAIVGVGRRIARCVGWLPSRARALWRRLRTGRR